MVATIDKLTWWKDSGHAWLKVRQEELERLGLADKISSYSFREGGYAYLEEDCDADKYLNSKFGCDWFKNEELLRLVKSIPCRLFKGPSPCRNYPRFI